MFGTQRAGERERPGADRSARFRWSLGSLLESLLRCRPQRRRPFGSDTPVTFLIWNAFSMGGTVRTTLQQASYLAAQGHPVTVVSVVRRPPQEEGFFEIHPDVRVETLVDRRRLRRRRGLLARSQRWLDSRPAVLQHLSIGRANQASLLVDLRLLWRVARTRRGALVGTRLGLNLAIARWGHPAVLRVAEEHLYFELYSPRNREALLRHFPHLDVVACLTHADAGAYRRALGHSGVEIAVLPNAIPDGLPDPTEPDRTRIVALGRLERSKGFGELIDAFAQVAHDFPAWTLSIVGDGSQRADVLDRIGRRGLAGRVELRPPTPDVMDELRRGSVFALSSRFESFGMVALEAMSAGMCVVAYASPLGPRELLEHRRTALLAPPGDVPALADALATSMGDERLRERLGTEARQVASAFELSRIGERWRELLASVAASGRRPARRRAKKPAGVGSLLPGGR